MDELVRATLKNGYIPKIVPEFPGITVGGAFNGTAGESTSWKWGFFDRGVNWVEIVLADGQVVRASREGVVDLEGNEIVKEDREKGELFLGAAGGMGTLGVGTLFEVQLMPVKGGKKGNVEVEYRRVRSTDEAISMFEQGKAEEGVEFMDGIMFSKDSGVVVLGRFSDGKGGRLKKVRFTRRHDPWFYLHAEKADNKSRELVPIFDYLFRYDRGAFWMASHSFGQWWAPFNRVGRWAWDGLMHTREQYKMMHATGAYDNLIVQDIVLPKRNIGKFVDWNTSPKEGFQVWPLWLCPFRADSQTVMHKLKRTPEDGDENELSINVGIWGLGGDNYAQNVAMNEFLEKKIQDLGGRKWLYGQVYYTKEDFWKIYNREYIETLRKLWNAEGLPTVWDKVRNKEGGGKQISCWQAFKTYRSGAVLFKTKEQ